ncbi:hypothetical protein [Paenibacillus sp.]|uniref:hypothetical protein n=1 Tax=Paenibacillus sp. TaxID=58172 RepID=UPI002810BAD8|nr:hypothetical protein [Paenibacillus sp.]
MTTIMLRPDLKTSGGEIHDILLNGRYAGNMTLVYRERDRIGGAVQLDRASMTESDKREVVQFVRNYIQDLILAVRAVDCDVVVTNSAYDHIIATNRDEAGRWKEMDDAEDYDLLADAEEDEDAYEDVAGFDADEYETLGDEDADNLDHIEMRTPDGRKAAYYELVVVSETRNKIEYHVYDQEMEWLAEAVFSTHGTDCFGEIRFMFLPGEDEIEAVTDLIVSDFDEDEIDSFDIRVLHAGEELERIELTHEDLTDDDAFVDDVAMRDDESDYTVTLARDDGDMLTYEIYNQRHGGLPIGTATVDIANRQLSGFIDFRDPVDEEEREIVATLLMRELDKEKEYKSLNLSVMHENVKIDELLFETDPVH